MTQTTENNEECRIGRGNEEGFALISILAILIPLALIVGASTSLMQGRTGEILARIRNERAFFAAESAISEALFQAQTGSLTSGVRIAGDLGNGMTFTAMPLYLGSDGFDNDGDMFVDEADEDVVRLMIVGSYLSAVRKVAAYLGRTSNMPKIDGAATFTSLNPGSEKMLNVSGGGSISGWEDGNPGSGIGVPGISVPLGTTAAATGRFGGSTLTKISGTPLKVGESAVTYDINDLITTLKNSADVVISGELSGATLGNAAANDFKIIYGTGEVILKSGTTGAGILVVEGFLKMVGNVHFDGLIIVRAMSKLENNGSVRGGFIIGPGTEGGAVGTEKLLLEVQGSKIDFSAAMLSKISAVIPGGKWVTFNGWHELSRHETAGF